MQPTINAAATATPRFVLVTGATGQQGGAVIQALLARGHRVRGLSRNPASAASQRLVAQGVEMVEGDFSKPNTLLRAADGVDTFFAMGMPNQKQPDVEVAHGLVMLEAARRAGVGHFVYSSVAGAHQRTGIPHFDSKYAVEQSVAASSVPYTVLAPVFFMDNHLLPSTLAGLAEGKLSLAMPASRGLQQVAVADIGAMAVAVIERREAVFGRRIEIAGDERTGTEAAAALTRVMGREIHYEGTSPERLRAFSDDMARMFEWFDTTGYSVDIEALHQEFPEVGWHRFADWAQTQDWDSLLPEANHA